MRHTLLGPFPVAVTLMAVLGCGSTTNGSGGDVDWFARITADLTLKRQQLERALPPGSEVMVNEVLAAGVVTGRVVDYETGAPLRTAQVWLDDSDYGVLTRADGSFVILNVIPGRYSLHAALVGYEEIALPMDVSPSEGLEVELRLEPQALINCDLVWWEGGPGSVGVRVRDAATGRRPVGPMRLRVGDGADEWGAEGKESKRGDSSVAATGSGRGPFAVEVSAPGYQVWVGRASELPDSDCPSGRIIDVWLLPATGS